MSQAIYDYSVPQICRALNVALNLLEKADKFAQENDIENTVLINDRLVATMHDFKRQIQILTDTAKNAVARLSSQEPVVMEDNETTLEQLVARVEKTLELVERFSAGDFAGAEDKAITMQAGPGMEATFKNGVAYVQGFVLPNLYFHLTTAYNLLRKNGVDIGKQDFLGAIEVELKPVEA